MQRNYYNLDRINEMLAFLLVLCRLNDARDTNIRYEADSKQGYLDELTPLEDLITHWTTLVNMQTDDDLQSDGECLVDVIKMEVNRIQVVSVMIHVLIVN